MSNESHDTKEKPRMCAQFPLVTQDENTLRVLVRSGWAGCPKTRCSTAGRTQDWRILIETVSWSSAEAEAKSNHKGLRGKHTTWSSGQTARVRAQSYNLDPKTSDTSRNSHNVGPNNVNTNRLESPPNSRR